MSNKNLTKEQLLKAIEQLEKNPNDKLGILADIGIGVVGAAGGGAAAAFFGATTAPILFGLMALPVAAPIGIIVGGVALGAAGLVGAKKILFDGTFTEGKQAEMLKQLQEQLREVEAKERTSKLGESDKTKFIVSLKEPLRLNLITPEDAEKLIKAVENGQMPLKDAIKIVKDLVKSAKP
jgi:hypothetical protein